MLTLLRQLLATHLKKCVHEKRLGYCETINRSIRYKVTTKFHHKYFQIGTSFSHFVFLCFLQLAGLQSDTYDELVYKMKNPATGVTAGKKKDVFLGMYIFKDSIKVNLTKHKMR